MTLTTPAGYPVKRRSHPQLGRKWQIYQQKGQMTVQVDLGLPLRNRLSLGP